MSLLKSIVRVGVIGLVVTACAGGAGAAWTYAPLGPTASPAVSTAPSAGASVSPEASAGIPIDVATEQADPLAFVPKELTAPPATLVTVNYNNNSNIPHNIHFFNGPDQSAPELAPPTETVTGPNAPRAVSFTTPEQTGDFFFWCDVHTTQMTGTLHVAQ